jgi:hypothetical protein
MNRFGCSSSAILDENISEKVSNKSRSAACGEQKSIIEVEVESHSLNIGEKN